MLSRTCTHVLPEGRRCRATPLRDEPFCFWHSPNHAEDAAEARRLGGLRRRREKAVSGAYEFEGLDTVASIRRLIEIATIDALGLDNSVARSRLLLQAAGAATKLLEVAELEHRIGRLEVVIDAARVEPPVFPKEVPHDQED
jgi:hypothetical protein